MEVRDVVGRIDRRIDGVDVDALLERRRQPACQYGRARDLVFPGGDLAVDQHSSDVVAIDRAVDVVLGVFLARPHHLHRIVHLLGHAHRRNHHVRLELAAEAAAEQVVVDDHLLDRQPRRLGGFRLHPAHDLRAGPDLASIRPDMNGGVQRLHRRVREERQLVCRLELFARRKSLGDVADRFGNRAVLFAGRAQVLPDVFRADLRVRPFVPVDLERVQALLGRPHVIADHGDHVVEHHDLAHAGNLLRGAVIDLADLAAEHGAGGNALRTSCPAGSHRCRRPPCR